MGIIVDEKHEVVITADSSGLIKTWHGRTGQEVASFPTASSHCSFLQYNVNHTWFLTVRRHRIGQDFETCKKIRRRWLFASLLGWNGPGVRVHAGGFCLN